MTATNMDTMTFVSQIHPTANEVRRSVPFKLENEEVDEIAELRYKLTKAKNETVQLVAKYNEELSSCQSQVAKLRSEVEKGEAVRQSLEYELAVARKQCGMERIALQEEKENSYVKQELFKAQIEELQKKMHTIEENFQSTQFGWQEAQKRLESDLKDRDLVIENYKKEQRVLMSEKASLETHTQKETVVTQELHQRLNELDREKNSLLDTVRRQKSEIAFGLEREDRLKQELEAAGQRVKRLEESIEAERAAHLESKFNSEIIQLRIRDLEASLQVEKSNQAQTSSDLDLIKSQFREVEKAYGREKSTAEELADKLHKLEKEYSYMVNEFKAEMEKRNQMITDLSMKLKTSEESLAVMEEDLEKSKKCQLSLEEAYGCNVRELQTLVESFNTLSHRQSGTHSDKDKAAGPAVLEALRHTLTGFQNKLESTSNELETKQRVCAGMKEELESSKQRIHTLRINLENIRSEELVSKKEFQSLSAAYSERESQVAQLQTELVKTRDTWEKEKLRALEAEQEIQKLTRIFQKDAEEKFTFLHGLYQRLVAGCVLLKEPESMMGNFSWPELCIILQENVDALISDLQRANEKVSHLEYACKNKADVLRDLQKKHEDSLDRLTQQMKEQQNSWQQKTKDLEQHYSVLLGEINSRAQKYQRIAEKSKDKISIYEKTKDQLALENVQIRNLLISTEKDHKSLLAACALMAGALYPLYSRACTLAAERNFLQDQMNIYVDVQREIRQLVQALSDSEVKRNGDSKRRPKYSRCMKYVFRRGVIVVLAANRLQQLGRSSRTLFTWMEDMNKGPSLLVCPVGGQSSKTLRPQNELMRCQEAWKWITSTDLLSAIITSMYDLLGVLNEKDPDSRSQRPLIDTTRNCFSKLMSKLNVASEARGVEPQRYCISVDTGSLVHRLMCGLHKVSLQTSAMDFTSTTPIMKCLAALKKQILGFTQRLHTAEVERRSLRRELSDIKQKISEISSDVGSTENPKAQKTTFQQSKVVPYEKFRMVFSELNGALLREQEAQILLTEQSQQLLELNHKIELHSQEEAEKDQTLSEAVKGLSETKMELRRKDQSLHQQNRQLTQLEQDKRRLEESISRAESALRTADREKEVITNYMKSVAAEFQKMRDQTSLSRVATSLQDFAFQLPKLSPKIFEMKGYTGGSDFSACQNMIKSFSDIYQVACTKAAALEREIIFHEKHIAALKSELQTACLRETKSLSPAKLDANTVPSSDFLPLQAEPDFSQSHMNFSRINSRTFQPIDSSSVSDLTSTAMQELPTKM
ncbi:coiled-coil domain-containing protein 171 [Bufo bufo]|uniref:coiled-coil domain-containing protein 171 n=1 Tax=Bufo bufo TaxID=8384 RepID=UPI001ABE97E2|nr:coiled-coil domain-containing protein 171 [Bufo bufo]